MDFQKPNCPIGTWNVRLIKPAALILCLLVVLMSSSRPPQSHRGPLWVSKHTVTQYLCRVFMASLSHIHAEHKYFLTEALIHIQA